MSSRTFLLCYIVWWMSVVLLLIVTFYEIKVLSIYVDGFLDMMKCMTCSDCIQDIISMRLCTVNCAERLHRWWCYLSYAKYACWRAIVLGRRLINLTEIMNSGWRRLAHWCFVKKRVLPPGRMDQMLVIISMRLKGDLNCRSACSDPHCSVDFVLWCNLIDINWREKLSWF